MTEETKKSKYAFDLSDGFGKDDIFAVFGGIWRFIKGILKVIFWPYVWIFRVFGRCIRFIRAKATDNPLSPDERAFIESIPGFFIITGIFSGVFLVALGVVIDENLMNLGSLFNNIDIGTILSSFGAFLFATYPDISVLEIILLIIGYDVRDSSGTIIHDRFGILDIIGFLFDLIAGIVDVITTEPLMLFVGIAVIGVVLAIIWIVISETGIVGGLVSVFSRIFSFLVSTPHVGFEKANGIYLRCNRAISSVIIGRNRLEVYSVGFHRKLLLYTFFLGLYTFFSGFLVIVSGRIPSDSLYGFILVILFTVGIGVGVLEMFVIVRFMDIISRGKYSTEKIKEKKTLS